MTRVYLPLTAGGLREFIEAGRLAGPLAGHAVTPALQRELAGPSGEPAADDEEAEYAATYAAADAAWLARTEQDPPRRYVLVVEVKDDLVTDSADPTDPTAVTVAGDVGRKQVAALHADVVNLSDETVAEADLAWFASQEIAHLDLG